jgi:curved DNA-binding protein CbpA
MRDYYKVLGVKRTADQTAIKHAYRNLLKQYHPDYNKGDRVAEEMTKMVNEAYEVLADEYKRKIFNTTLEGHSMPNQIEEANESRETRLNRSPELHSSSLSELWNRHRKAITFFWLLIICAIDSRYGGPASWITTLLVFFFWMAKE